MLVLMHDEDNDMFVVKVESIKEISSYGTDRVRVFCDDGDYWIVPGTVEEMTIRLNRLGEIVVAI